MRHSGKKLLLRLITILFLAQISMLIIPSPVFAIPPPEILRIGSQIFQAIAFILVFLTAMSLAFFSKIKGLLKTIFAAKIWLKALLIFVVFGLAAAMFIYIRLEINRVNKINASLTRDNSSKQTLAKSNNKQSLLERFGEKKLLQNMELFSEESLKEANLKYGISASEVNRLVADYPAGHQFIDVREAIEYQKGHIPGFKNIRYADLLYTKMYKSLNKKKNYVFFCHSGERGWKVAAFLKSKGFNARFVIGGLRRWLKEGFDWQGSTMFPPVPQFTNKNNFLSTDEARAYYQKNEIIFVDLRERALFLENHMPNAVNIPLMYLPSHKIDSYINKIPKNKGVVTVGYDRLSSYYSEILGYMLVDKGYEFRGRYQFPEEY